LCFQHLCLKWKRNFRPFSKKKNREPNTEKEAAFCGKGIEIEKTQTEMEKQPREPFPTETEVAGKINTKNF
jgi:hypothetical protein